MFNPITRSNDDEDDDGDDDRHLHRLRRQQVSKITDFVTQLGKWIRQLSPSFSLAADEPIFRQM